MTNVEGPGLSGLSAVGDSVMSAAEDSVLSADEDSVLSAFFVGSPFFSSFPAEDFLSLADWDLLRADLDLSVGSLVGLTLGPSRFIAGVRLCLVAAPKIFVTTMVSVFAGFEVEAVGSLADVVGS